MRRLWSSLVGWLAGASFVVFLIAGVLWPASYWHLLEYSCNSASEDLKHDLDLDFTGHLAEGATTFVLYRTVARVSNHTSIERSVHGLNSGPVRFRGSLDGANGGAWESKWELLGFAYEFRRDQDAKDEPWEPVALSSGPLIVSSAFLALRLPMWFIVVATGILPTIWVRSKWRLRRRRKNGLCLYCGYDLRATPDLCPECGVKPSPVPTKSKRLLRSLSSVSLVIAIAASGLWAASYWRATEFILATGREQTELFLERSFRIAAHDGLLIIGKKNHLDKDLEILSVEPDQYTGKKFPTIVKGTWAARDALGEFPIQQDPPMSYLIGSFAFAYDLTHGVGNVGDRSVPLSWSDASAQIPLWFIVLLTAALPGCQRLVTVRRKRSLSCMC